MTPHNFEERLNFSKGQCLESDCATLKSMIPGEVDVRVASTQEDKAGTDYFVTLRKGAELKVDAKNRDRGMKRYWDRNPRNPFHEEELTLEKWSVAPSGGLPGKVGWTLCERRNTDLILYKFHPDDSKNVLLVSFPLLRIAFRQNIAAWEAYHGVRSVPNNGYTTVCLYVPASEVFAAMTRVQVGKLQIPEERFVAETFTLPLKFQ